MAYCVATKTQACSHINLWKVGASSAKTVPGSTNAPAPPRVALAAGKQGRLSVVWYDVAKNVIRAVRTNTSATGFGLIRSIKPPAHTSSINRIQAEGTFGRLDVIVNDSLTTGPIDLFHTQILAGMKLTASPSSFSHTKATTVTFKVADAGQGVKGAKVTCIGKSATTGSAGTAKISYPKGTPAGKHVCTAKKSGYNPGKTTIRVT